MRVTNTLRSSAISILGGVALVAALAFAGRAVSHAAADTSPPLESSPGQLFGVHPLQEGSTTLPGGHFNFALVPGQIISDGIVVENFSDHALTSHVYGADVVTAAGGGLTPAQATATKHEVGAWIIASIPTLVVPAHSQVADNFTLTMPAVVSPGDHLGAVVVAADVGFTPQGSTIEARAALIAVVTVPGSAHPSASLNLLAGSTVTPGQIGFGITLSNTGNVLLTYRGSLLIDDSAGHLVVTLPLTPTNAYVVPGGQVPLAAVWKQSALPPEGYRARATITIRADGTSVGTLTSQSLALPFSSGIPTVVVALCALAAVVVVLLAMSFVRRGSRRRRTRARSALVRRLGGVA